MLTEVNITIKSAGRKYKEKFLHYDEEKGPLTLSHDDMNLRNYVENASVNFPPEPEDIIVTTNYVW